MRLEIFSDVWQLCSIDFYYCQNGRQGSDADDEEGEEEEGEEEEEDIDDEETLR